MAGMQVPRRVLTWVLIVALGALGPGCRKPVPPVAETDWRSHVSLPERVERNWVLPDNKMLVEVTQSGSWPAPTVPSYAYEIYDPRTGSTTTVVPADYMAYVQSVSEQTVKFTAGNFTGARYLLRYDLAKRRLAEEPMWYSANETHRFGLTNCYDKWKGIRISAAGIDLTASGYPCPIPYFVVRPRSEQDELWLEFPGLKAEAGQFGPVVTGHMPPPVTSASLVDGVADGGRSLLPGLTLRLQLESPDWSRLTFGLIGPRRGVTANRLTFTLSQSELPSDQTPTLGVPRLWDEWRQWAALDYEPVTRSWALNSGLRLVELADRYEPMYGLCDPDAQLSALIVGLSDAAVPVSIASDRVVMLADGSGVSPFPTWPYLITIDPASRIVEHKPVNVSVSQAAVLGGYCSVLDSVLSEGDGLRLRFVMGPTAAGGSGPPRIMVRPVPAVNQLLVQFHNSGMFPDYPAHEALTLGPIDVTGVPFVTAAVLEAGIAGADGKMEPGVTLRLTLIADGWNALTYRFIWRELPAGAPPDGSEGSLVLLFSDLEKADDISSISERFR